MKQLFNFKTLVMVMFAVALLGFTSCAKSDDRDQFVGDYNLRATGNLTLTVNGQNYSEAINQTTTISIYKTAEESIVEVNGYYDCKAFVSGNTISMDPMTGTQTTNDGITYQMIVTPRRGTLNGSVLTFISDITGTAYYQGNSFPISGMIYNEATKR